MRFETAVIIMMMVTGVLLGIVAFIQIYIIQTRKPSEATRWNGAVRLKIYSMEWGVRLHDIDNFQQTSPHDPICLDEREYSWKLKVGEKPVGIFLGGVVPGNLPSIWTGNLPIYSMDRQDMGKRNGTGLTISFAENRPDKTKPVIIKLRDECTGRYYKYTIEWP